jgi:hypothetical protein
MMEHETILYISDQANSNPVLVALNGTGYEVVSTNRATQGVALLYVMHSFVAVVLSHQAKEQDLARSLRAIRPDVPIIVLCRDQIDSLGSCGETAVIPPGLAGNLERVSHDNYSPQFPLQLINIARLQYFRA